MILDIESGWSKEPGWFQTLNVERQTQLFAWWKVKHEHKANA